MRQPDEYTRMFCRSMEAMLPNTFIKPSNIPGAGLGLFALKDIRKGARLIRGKPSHTMGLHQDEWIRYMKSGHKSDALHYGTCMVNHAVEQANAVRHKNGHIIAGRDIKKGEEIYENYNLLPDDNNPLVFSPFKPNAPPITKPTPA